MTRKRTQANPTQSKTRVSDSHRPARRISRRPGLSERKDAANTKMLAFDGVFITLYTIALEKSHMVVCDRVKKSVPSSWEPAALSRFIKKFGTHIIVGVKMGGKDVIYMKQQHSSTLQPADMQRRLNIMADKRFVDADGQNGIEPEQVYQSSKICE